MNENQYIDCTRVPFDLLKIMSICDVKPDVNTLWGHDQQSLMHICIDPEQELMLSNDDVISLIKDLIIYHKANVNLLDGHRNTPLHLAVKDNNYFVIKCLLDNKAKWDIKNYDGQTSFEMALHAGNENILNLFKNYGAKVTQKTINRLIDQNKYYNQENFTQYIIDNEYPKNLNLDLINKIFMEETTTAKQLLEIISSEFSEDNLSKIECLVKELPSIDYPSYKDGTTTILTQAILNNADRKYILKLLELGADANAGEFPSLEAVLSKSPVNLEILELIININCSPFLTKNQKIAQSFMLKTLDKESSKVIKNLLVALKILRDNNFT